VCGQCRVPCAPAPADLAALGVTGADGVVLARGAGCAGCRGTGYRGRTGIYELLRVTDDIRSLVLRREPAGAIRRQAVAAGMLTLAQDGWAKARDGLTTVEEILRVTQEDA
jgi:type II secretory ATPase GspE/PulE/Tfp pilus assembly ATPase PilB-like protein